MIQCSVSGCRRQTCGLSFCLYPPLSTGAKKWLLDRRGAKQWSDLFCQKFFIKMSWRDSFSDNGAKRGRTETSPPSLRPITPVGAKLGDWMKEIEAKINSIRSQIKSIHRSHEASALSIKIFRECQEANFVALDKKISQIMGRLDKIEDDAKATDDFLQTEFEGFDYDY